MQSRHATLIAEYVLCIDEKRYYDAHEALEEIWFSRRFEDDNEMKLLKGFINASVSFELIKRGRKEPAKRAWSNYLKYRGLLYKFDSPFLNNYNSICRKIDKIHHTKSA